MEIQTLSIENEKNVQYSPVKNSITSSLSQAKTENIQIDKATSMAAKAYAMPQINFEGKWDKMLAELKSPKQSNKIKMSFDEAATFLEKLGFSPRGGKGSHCNFIKEGATPITIPRPHDGHNTVKPYIIDSLRDYVAKNNITEL